MSDNKKLQNAFLYIRETFFPRWDKQNQWRVKIDPELPSKGLCESKIKMIYLGRIPESEVDLHLLLIHEICHSSRLGHTKKWSERMKKASDTAQRLGHKDLAIKIQGDLDSYKKGEILYAKDIYSKFPVALMDQPDASYVSILKWIAGDLGMYPEELEKTFKKCREAYEKAKKRQQKVRQKRAEIERLLQKEKI